MSTTPVRLRPATPADLDALVTIEREANTTALADIYPPDQFPFPTEEIRTRWQHTLAEPGVSITLALPHSSEDPQGYVAYTNHDVRHLAVTPASWGSGLARALLAHALAHSSEQTMTLWVIEANHRARGLYEHLGWTPTGERKDGLYPPFPTEIRLATSAISSSAATGQSTRFPQAPAT